jgi:hypothetical protein
MDFFVPTPHVEVIIKIQSGKIAEFEKNHKNQTNFIMERRNALLILVRDK